MMDYEKTIMIDESGITNTETSEIKGVLECFIVRSDVPISINIVLNKYPSIELLKLENVIGEKYYPVIMQGITSRGEIIKESTHKIILNDKLLIEIRGPKNKKVEITTRYSNVERPEI